MVVQINGKLRARITVETTADNTAIQTLAVENEKIKPYLENKAIKKVIVVPNKLINIVVGEK